MSKTYYEENNDKMKEYRRKYYEENNDKIKEYHRKYRDDNPEIIKEKHKIYRANNQDIIKEKNKKYKEENRPRCNNSWCNTQVNNNKYEGYCLRCFMYTYPDKPIARNYKTKERAVADFILQYFPNFTWYCDKKIPDGCSKRRPDLFLDLGYCILIIEIDENQHTVYSSTCEEARINNISMDLNNRPVVMIRFNPDEYQDKEEKVKSCWEFNKLCICVVKKNKIKEWKNRLNVLKENIEPFLNPDYNQDEPLKIINLFYDEN